MILAHGIGGRADLPLPGELVLQAGGFVVLVSFLAVGLLWRRPRFADETPRPADTEVPEPAAVWVARAVMLLIAGYLAAVAFLGSTDPEVNPAPRALYVLLWVGVVPASLLLGRVWWAVNPLRGLHRALAGLLRLPSTGVRPLPDWLGYWPAAAGLAVFVWLELVPRERTEPPVVGAFLLVYAVLVTVAALVYGAGAFARIDPFEVYSSLVAVLAPVRRRPDGRLGGRSPLRELARIPPAPGLIAVLAVWWGSTVFDGLSGWTGWLSLRQAGGLPPMVLDTAALVILIGLVAVSYRMVTGALAGSLVSTLIPIAVGYTIAHYASLLLVEGPRGMAQLVAPGGPTATGQVGTLPAPVLIAVIQVAAILLGHVIGVIAAHDRSAALLPAQRRLADQIPLVLLMIVYTMVGLYLLVIA